MNTQKKITAKETIAQQLFENTTSQFPSSLITEILERLEDTREYSSISGNYDHSVQNLSDACFISTDEFSTKLDKLQKYHESDECDKVSKLVEFAENTLTHKEACFLAVSTMHRMSTMESASGLIKLLKGLGG